jgi:hypothetical protein
MIQAHRGADCSSCLPWLDGEELACKQVLRHSISIMQEEIRLQLQGFVDNAVSAGGEGELDIAPPSTAAQLEPLLTRHPHIADGLIEVFGGVSAHIECDWELPRTPEDRDYSGIASFSGWISLSLATTYELDVSDFAVVDEHWRHKLVFADMGSGDFIAIDLNRDTAGQVVYLSHDLDPRSHGQVLAPSFPDFLRRWASLGCPSMDGGGFRGFCSPRHRYLDPASPNGRRWREAVAARGHGLPAAPVFINEPARDPDGGATPKSSHDLPAALPNVDALLHVRAGDGADIEQLMTKLRESPNSMLWKQLAYGFYQMADWSRMEQCGLMCIGSAPQDYYGWMQYGLALQKRGQFAEAARAFDSGLCFSSDLDLRVNAAVVHHLAGDDAVARALLLAMSLEDRSYAFREEPSLEPLRSKL